MKRFARALRNRSRGSALRADHVAGMKTPNSSRTQAGSERPVYRDDVMGRPADWAGLCWLLFVGSTVFVLCLPFMHSIFGLGDEGVLLHGAERLLRGQRLYVDFFEFHPPGGFVIVTAWFGITGVSLWSARLLAILTITGIACFTYLACRQASRHPPSSALVAIGWAVMSQGVWTQISHHWFTTLLSMVAAWAALTSVEKPQRWRWQPLVAGVAAGAAAMVTPTRGALAMLAAATSFVGSRRQRTRLISYALGSAFIPICLLAYVISQGALAAAFDDVIVFTATRYASIQSVPFSYITDDQSRPLKYLFQLVALLTLVICIRDWRTSLHDRLFRTCVAFGLAGFIGCFPRPDMAHIAFATPLVCPLLAYCTNRIVASWSRKFRYALAALVISLCIPSVAAFSSAANIALQGELVATPRGRATFLNNGTRELMERIAAAPSSDRYFFYPFIPMLPFLTAREHVSKVDLFFPYYTTPSQYQEVCISVLRHASWLVVDRNWTARDLRRLRRSYPAIPDTASPETERFELALQSGFELVARDGAFELRRRVKTVDETVCAGIAE
jgi:Dolichyl-phosphate-mannose-protein mannosyltransferase